MPVEISVAASTYKCGRIAEPCRPLVRMLAALVYSFGVFGLYLGKTFTKVKTWPLFIVRDLSNLHTAEGIARIASDGLDFGRSQSQQRQETKR